MKSWFVFVGLCAPFLCVKGGKMRSFVGPGWFEGQLRRQLHEKLPVHYNFGKFSDPS